MFQSGCHGRKIFFRYLIEVFAVISLTSVLKVASAKTLAVRSSNTTAETGESHLICATIAENATASLQCWNGELISTTFASFGSPGGSCGAWQPSSCHSTISRDLVIARCNGKTHCQLNASVYLFGRPCWEDALTLAIEARCIPRSRPSEDHVHAVHLLESSVGNSNTSSNSSVNMTVSPSENLVPPPPPVPPSSPPKNPTSEGQEDLTTDLIIPTVFVLVAIMIGVLILLGVYPKSMNDRCAPYPKYNDGAEDITHMHTIVSAVFQPAEPMSLVEPERLDL
ncbi:hypothetical protein CYMTET_37863 [Cymbomonas tetramitiformis]|uniref:SUEL-type lectin domain-containing protein n=1 Tax=Cymbomonas tetramitiformis TaxID=36881 RepID=A0AAE0F5T2_9CHLO|nr:hypothetical protein CYMTET_37863 [Cymbomonas tetramitiformis]